MCKFFLTILTVLFWGCNSSEKHSFFDATLNPSSKIILDESKIIHKVIPNEFLMIGDTAIICIANHSEVAIYDIRNGKMLNNINVDSAIKNEHINSVLDSFTKYELQAYFPDRLYIDRNHLRNDVPYSMAFQILDVESIDSNSYVWILSGVTSQYKKDFVIKDKSTDATFISKTEVVFRINLKTRIADKALPVSSYKLNPPNMSEDSVTYSQPSFGSFLINKSEILIPTTYSKSSGNSYREKNMVTFNLNSKPNTFDYVDYKFPDSLKHDLFSWNPKFHFYRKNNNVYFHGLFSVSALNDKKCTELFNIRNLLNSDSLQHI
ncbi:MAG: hypothetical protein QM642_00450 [Edaphocola sp.]